MGNVGLKLVNNVWIAGTRYQQSDVCLSTRFGVRGGKSTILYAVSLGAQRVGVSGVKSPILEGIEGKVRGRAMEKKGEKLRSHNGAGFGIVENK